MPYSAQQAYHDAAAGGGWIMGWRLDIEQRRELLLQFPPAYADIVADHVTLRSGVAANAVPPSGHTGEIVGRVDDERGVEALVVRIGEATDRPGGGTYHITWSLDAAGGRTAKESNDAIARLGWIALDLPMPLLLVPACWRRGSRALAGPLPALP